MSKLVTIYGGSGFVGRYIARRMAKQGWRVRVATRNPDECLRVRTYGAVGQVQPFQCNLRDEASVKAAMHTADAVVNCVGILANSGKNTFGNLHVEGAERVARAAAAEGVGTFVHISAIGADEAAGSEYLRTKGLGEKAVLKHVPEAVILRPSIIFGPEDKFFNRFAQMSMFGPMLSIVGADTKFQPVYVDDVAAAVEKAVLGEAEPGVYELGGPDVATFREWMALMLKIVHRKRAISNTSFGRAKFLAGLCEFAQKASFGVVSAPITKDQVESLKTDNVVHDGVKTFADLGIKPAAPAAVLPEYLWGYRPTGQYDDMMASAKNLKV